MSMIHLKNLIIETKLKYLGKETSNVIPKWASETKRETK